MAHAPAHHPTHLDDLDPHGFSGKGQHASHVIVGPFTLRTVLAVLLFFTVLTVAQAQAELFLTHALDIEFPRWVNVAFCMGIAVIKAALVMGFFMQLKYDNPINSVVMAFTFLGLALFLGFTSLDLTGRSTVYEWKNVIRAPGGTKLITANAKKAAIDRLGSLQEFERVQGIILHAHPEHLVSLSSPDMSRGKTGLSGALDAAAPHEGGHEEHPAPAEATHAEAPAPAH